MQRILLLLILSTTLVGKSYSQTEVSSVEKAQALFIYNFTKYVDNPVKTGDYKIVILGNARLAKELDNRFASGKLFNGQTVVVTNADDVAEVKEAQLVFISDHKSSKLDEVLALTKNTLIVTERSSLLGKGSCINFIFQQDKLKFQLSEEACTKQGLQISKSLAVLAVK